MQIMLMAAGVIILLIAAWFLSAELEKIFFGGKQAAAESDAVIGSLDDVEEEESVRGWVENFGRWAGPRLPVSAERIGFTLLWLFFFVTLVDHLRSRSSLTSTLVYFLVILPHEAGHFLCSPFGWFLSVAGGSIWQILLFVLFGFIVLYRKRRNEALGWWAVAGHSLINLSVYIADASARSLPLIPIPDPARHDWGNMLEYLGLLEYDWLFALLATVIGGGVVLSTVAAGLFFTWYQPSVKGDAAAV